MTDAKILIVEKDEPGSAHLEECLKHLGYRVCAAVTCGRQAIEKAADLRPDLALVDLELEGEVSGLETGAQIGSRFDVPVMYLTDRAEGDLLQRAQATYPFGYVLRPFDERQLHLNIRTAFSMHERESGHKQTQTRLKRLVGKYKDLTRLLGAEGVGRPRPAQGQDGGGGRHHAGSQRRDAQHRAPGHGQSLPRVPGRAGPGRQVCGADEGDTASLAASLDQADRNLQEVPVEEKTALSEVVTDKGYHSNHTMKTLKEAKIRSYVSEPDRGRRNWKKDAPAKAAVYANRRRLRGERGKRLQRRRAEYAERSFAHTYESGGMRRTHLRGHTNIYKRLCIHGGAFNPGLAMRKLTGKRNPEGVSWAVIGFGNLG